MTIAQCINLVTRWGPRFRSPAIACCRPSSKAAASRAESLQQPTESMEGRVLTPQAFSSNLLNRSTQERRDVTFLEQALPHARLLLVSGRLHIALGMQINRAPLYSIAVRLSIVSLHAGNKCSVKRSGEDLYNLCWHTLQDLKRSGFHEASGGLTYSENHLRDSFEITRDPSSFRELTTFTCEERISTLNL